LGHAQLCDAIAQIVGVANVLSDPQDTERYVVDARRRYFGAALCIARPADTRQVSNVVEVCAKAGVAIVPQGGNTGMCGGATPDPDIPSVVLSLERMNRIRDLDLANGSLTVDAGCRLADVQKAADDVGRLFPLSLGSEGACQIGGNIATNAGGTAVLRYGPMRDLVLGLEAVLPDGRIWNGLRGLRKDNTGYDLKHLMIGSEGTLGVITGAVLKLFARPVTSVTALVAVGSIHGALDLLGEMRRSFGERITTFEVMSKNEYELVLDQNQTLRNPLATHANWFVFLEITDSLAAFDIRTALVEQLANADSSIGVLDAVIAETLSQAEQIWKIRHGVTEANLKAGAAVSHDTSVPVSRIADFVIASEKEIAGRFPDAGVYFVGHAGDGNIHVIAIFPRESYPDEARFSQVAGQVNAIVDEITASLGGSISAEHGIGRSNRVRLAERKDPVELEFMRRIKAMFDPQHLMNPGKVL
jgi:FAD/FMN-containing dehydrogenase